MSKKMNFEDYYHMTKKVNKIIEKDEVALEDLKRVLHSLIDLTKILSESMTDEFDGSESESLYSSPKKKLVGTDDTE